MAPASEVQICNLGLLKFGNLRITSLNDETAEGRACKLLYPLMRDQLLYRFPWNFAMKRVDITGSLTDTPAFGWDYAYSLPPDCCRVWEFYGNDAEWEVEYGRFLTNEDEEIYIRYIAYVTESGRFNPIFANCLATMIGAELATKLAKSKTARQELLQELETVLLPEAYALNAMEGKRPLSKDEQDMSRGNYSWQTEGR